MKKAFIGLMLLLVLSFSSIAHAAEDDMMENNLADVTNGAEIRGIVTPSDATGHASVMLEDGIFSLHAKFSGLADPVGEDFYEGWLVQQSPLAFISTGELYMKDGKYHNRYESTTDYTAYDFYVLTLEPNDGDDAPADHIFEGTVVMKTTEMMDDTMEMKKKEMMSKRELIKEKIRLRTSNLSQEKMMIVLERVNTLKLKLDTLNLSAQRRAIYDEVLAALTEVLEEDIMMKKEMMDK